MFYISIIMIYRELADNHKNKVPIPRYVVFIKNI